MTPQDFIRKWKPVALTERATAQEHFIDLCRLFDHPTPAEDDPVGDHFTFEKGAPKTGGGEGWADVWKKGFFAWEYKKKKRDLGKALEQLTRYAAALENPPLHVACDTHIFRIETRWTNEVPAKYEFELDDLAEPMNLAHLARRLPRSRRTALGPHARQADQGSRRQVPDDLGLAPASQSRPRGGRAFRQSTRLLLLRRQRGAAARTAYGRSCCRPPSAEPEQAQGAISTRLFDDMAKGGDFDLENIARVQRRAVRRSRRRWRLQHTEIGLLFAAASLDWSLIDPTIFGTLFERFLDPDKRAQIGAHYTDPEKIMMIVEPVVLRPLRAEWETAKARIEAIMAPVLEAAGGNGKAASRDLGKRFDAARAKAEAERDAFIDRLCGLRILDPACGSGNFLYLALQGVKDIEWRAILDCETLGLGMAVPRVGPEILHGIEINPFAAELARTTIWIGDIQWRVKNAITHHPRPILRKLDSIECRDALLTPDGKGGFVEAAVAGGGFHHRQPAVFGRQADAARARRRDGRDAVQRSMRPRSRRGGSRLLLVRQGLASLAGRRAKRVGLVATNSIRGGANRKVLEPIAEARRDFRGMERRAMDGRGRSGAGVAWCVLAQDTRAPRLNGWPTVVAIHADLSAETSNLAKALPLRENAMSAFMGDTKGGPFEIPSEARAGLA